jgi:predicted amidohydrolase YtcJ
MMASPNRTRLSIVAKRASILASVLLVGLLVAAWRYTRVPVEPSATTARIYVAKKIITLESDRPVGTAVAVREGRILAVGDRTEVQAALGAEPFTFDETFADKVLLPGFIDPHLHPSLAATILPLEIVSAMQWTTPEGRTEPARSRDAYLERLRALDASMSDPDEWLLTWGYHEPYHGKLERADLDEISVTRPIFVWQRSCHEMFFNSKALQELGLRAEDFDAHAQADWGTGHLWEAAALTLGAPMLRVLAWPPSYRRGLAMMSEVVHRGGLTTIAEQGFPQVNQWGELLMLKLETWKGNTPYRVVLVPNAMFLMKHFETAREAEEEAARMLELGNDRVRFVKHVKYYADGAIFSQLMQLSKPYLDGHRGEWMMEPEVQAEVLSEFWRKGWDFHIHVNGDAGLDLVLDQVEAQRRAHPDSRNRVVLEHYGYAREDQHRRLRALDIAVSNNAYYLHELAPIYAKHGLGPERAAEISPLGGLARAGVPISFHSDYLMAPAEPLLQVWTAVNRIGSDGRVWGEDQKLSLELALRGVTLEAARSLGLEDEIGSIRQGKRADFTILEQDPFSVPPMALAEIPIWGTVLGGVPHPID